MSSASPAGVGLIPPPVLAAGGDPTVWEPEPRDADPARAWARVLGGHRGGPGAPWLEPDRARWLLAAAWWSRDPCVGPVAAGWPEAVLGAATLAGFPPGVVPGRDPVADTVVDRGVSWLVSGGDLAPLGGVALEVLVALARDLPDGARRDVRRRRWSVFANLVLHGPGGTAPVWVNGTLLRIDPDDGGEPVTVPVTALDTGDPRVAERCLAHIPPLHGNPRRKTAAPGTPRWCRERWVEVAATADPRRVGWTGPHPWVPGVPWMPTRALLVRRWLGLEADGTVVIPSASVADAPVMWWRRWLRALGGARDPVRVLVGLEAAWVTLTRGVPDHRR